MRYITALIFILFYLTAQAEQLWPYNTQRCHKVLAIPQAAIAPIADSQRLPSRPRITLRRLETRKTTYFHAPSGRQMAYDFIPPQNPQLPVLITLHGLGDYRQALQGFALKGVQAGLGLLRMDLNGHGETLQQALAKGHVPQSQNHHYNSNIEDIFALILHTGVKKIILAGHSYGGGLSYKLGETISLHQQTHGLELQLIVMMAPYVQRIDKYWENFALNFLQFPWGGWGDVSRSYQELFMGLFGAQQLKDYLQDTISDPLFHHQFNQYFTERIAAKNEGSLTEKDVELAQQQTITAHMTMKGARDLDYLNPLNPLPSVDVPVIVLGARHDKTVPFSQLVHFGLRLEKEGKPVKIIELDDDSGHFFPQTHGENAYDRTIGEFLRNQRSRN